MNLIPCLNLISYNFNLGFNQSKYTIEELSQVGKCVQSIGRHLSTQTNDAVR